MCAPPSPRSYLWNSFSGHRIDDGLFFLFFKLDCWALLHPSPPGSCWCDVHGFVLTGSISSSSTLQITWAVQPQEFWKAHVVDIVRRNTTCFRTPTSPTPTPTPTTTKTLRRETVQQVVLIEAATVLMSTMCKERRFRHWVNAAYYINHFLASSHQGGKRNNRCIMLMLLSWAHADRGVQSQ